MRQQTVLAAAVVAIALANATPARAQLATMTFVSGDGLDTNPCTLSAPCRSFQRAHDQTAAGGQITMLDPAGYGTIAITKAISIINDGGGEAGITEPGSGSFAITINVGASDVVNLRGLTLNGVGVAGVGINFNHGGTLNLQNCVIRGFSNTGVRYTGANPGSVAITIADTIFSSNGNGLEIQPQGGTTSASLERVTAIGNSGIGIEVASALVGLTTQATIADSAAIGNRNQGFLLGSGVAAATIALVNSQAIGNGDGLETTTGTIIMSRVTVAGNHTNGFFNNGGTLQTFGDNYIIDTNNSGTLTPIAEQ